MLDVVESRVRWLESFKNQKMDLSAQVIAVASGKGGVGKTLVATRTALQFARLQHRILLIDADFNLSNTLIAMGSFRQMPAQTAASVTTYQRDWPKHHGQWREQVIHLEKVDLLSGCNGDIDLVGNESLVFNRITSILAEAKDEYDYIVVDLPAGVSPYVLQLCALANERFVVVNPDKSSITDAYSLIKILNYREQVKQNCLIVNRYRNNQQYERVTQTLASTVKKFLGEDLQLLPGIRDFGDQDLARAGGSWQRENSALKADFENLLKSYLGGGRKG